MTANAPSLTHANRHASGGPDPVTPAAIGADVVGAAAAVQAASLQKSANLGDVVSAATARTNLGLGSVVTHAFSEFSSTPPHQFAPESYGAKGDGKVIADVVLNSTTTITSATAAFTSADTGKTIMINGGKANNDVPLVATMTYVNATTVTLSVAATVSGSAFQAVYGTDDTAAINSALAAAKTYALANSYFAEIVFGAKIYMLTSGPTQATGPSVQTNAQILIPWPNINGTTQKLVIQLTGAGDNGYFQYWESLTPNVAGTALVSTLTSAPSSPSGSFGQQSVIGGPSAGGVFAGGYANVKVVVKGIEVISPIYTNQYAFDFGYVSAMRVVQSSAHIFAPSGVNGGNGPLLKDQLSALTLKIGTGLRSPVNSNNADVVIDDFTVEGYSRGLYLFDHATCGRIGTIYNDVALIIDTTQGAAGTTHAIAIELLCAEAYNGGILVVGSSGMVPVYIRLDSECPALPGFDVQDTGNVLVGEVRWTDVPEARTVPTISGCGNLKVVNDKMGPGKWTGAPAVPASTVAQQNTSYRDAVVVVTGGTVSAVSVDGVAQGYAATGFTVIVPGGKNITLTYSAAPSWKWTLL